MEEEKEARKKDREYDTEMNGNRVYGDHEKLTSKLWGGCSS